jgi:hypothetical protein
LHQCQGPCLQGRHVTLRLRGLASRGRWRHPEGEPVASTPRALSSRRACHPEVGGIGFEAAVSFRGWGHRLRGGGVVSRSGLLSLGQRQHLEGRHVASTPGALSSRRACRLEVGGLTSRRWCCFEVGASTSRRRRRLEFGALVLGGEGVLKAGMSPQCWGLWLRGDSVVSRLRPSS